MYKSSSNYPIKTFEQFLREKYWLLYLYFCLHLWQVDSFEDMYLLRGCNLFSQLLQYLIHFGKEIGDWVILVLCDGSVQLLGFTEILTCQRIV